MIVVRVISLRRSTARRAAMQAQLETVDRLNWNFFDACEAVPEGLRYDAAAAVRAVRRPLTTGELGCFASHWTLWRWLGEQAAGTVLAVLEDDLLLDPEFFAALPELVARLPAEYVRLYAKAPAPARVIGRLAGRHLVRYRGIAFGTQAYLLQQSAAAKLCASITRIVRPIDDEMDRYWAHRVANIGLFPFPVLEIGGPSTIEAGRRGLPPPRWHELGWQSRRTAESLRRRAANLRLDLGLAL